MDTQEFSFWDLICKYQIEIPAIQRDYAQGRIEEVKIAKLFIDDLHESLIENKKIDMHFVYGKINGNRLIPLDGQQRLTTLFLLHWFLSLGHSDENIKGILSKLKYETRPSSEDFCRKLVKEGIVYDKDTDIIAQIKDAKWFFISWKNDPTVSAMLNMLKIIKDKFKTPDKDLFNLLIGADCPIKFHFLPLEKYKMEDEIYVKMNARGKPLTEFENIKANFSVLFDIESKPKLDNEWLDIFWKLELKEATSSINIEKVDKKYFNFLKNITLNFYVETKDIEKNLIEEFDIYDYYKEVYSPDTAYLCKLSKVLDALQSYDDKEKYFINFLVDAPTYEERLQFYALSLFFIAQGNLNDTNREIYNKWMRVCRNLINNYPINNPEIFYKAIRSIKKLSANICDLYEFIINPESEIQVFLRAQWKEEKIKANLILNHNGKNWNEKICEIENHPYFDGQIGFILNFSKDGEDYDIDRFSDYSCKLGELFGEKHQEKNDYQFQRALLACGNYLPNISSGQTFCTFNPSLREKNDNWRKVFNDSAKSAYLKELLDTIDVNNIEDSLGKIINAYPDDNNDWRSLFIKNAGIIEYCNNYRIAKWDNGYKIVLSRSNANYWRRHAELYSYTLFKKELENKQFAPFTKTWYWDAADYEPCAVLDKWYYKNHHFAINILRDYNDTNDSAPDNKCYSFLFFDRNGNMIPSEIQRIIESLDFRKNENDDRWKHQIYGKTFEEVTKEIINLTSKLSEISNDVFPVSDKEK
ncbi:MAG: DUF262 domain-containing protein [Campylobacteraceae bacterium]|jgi:hypothetical protein|nr:DUF262 domain-containing protein [Campylobacteraceae bacterium]